jgi:pyrroline-5-carboxylate reductase
LLGGFFEMVGEVAMNIVVLGFGNMGTALVSGMLAKRVVSSEALFVVESDALRADAARALGLRVFDSSEALAATELKADILLCSVKPQQSKQAFSLMANSLTGGSSIVSIMAGVSCSTIRESIALPQVSEHVAIARAMPNLPVCYGLGMTGLFYEGVWASRARELVGKIFLSVGEVLEVEDEQGIDKVTAVSGSGPAYFYYLAEQLVAGATELGFSDEQASVLVAQTFRGAAEHIAESGLSAGDLRKMVTSPGGTTEAAIRVFENGNTGTVVREALRAAFARAGELSKG